jgi:nitrite reductase/ring-hydroxylating ferredoxin subunit/uncharacterized membrane protein
MPRLFAILERLADRVERMSALDRPADGLQRLTGLLPPGAVKDALSGTPVGHPLHPLAVTVPIGAFVSAAFLDATGGDPTASRRLIGFGLTTALPSALTGLNDWNDVQGGERRVGVVHAACSTAGLALLTSSWLARRAGGRGKVRALAGVAMIGASGWLGGHLTYAHGVGVDTTAFQRPPTEWTDACREDELTGAPLAVTLENMPVLLVRDVDGLHALADRCTHRGGPLSQGVVRDGCVECPWHQSRFDLTDGSVRRGPASRPAATLEVRVLNGVVQVRRSEVRALRLNPTS